MYNWILELNDAIKDLEARRKLLMKSCLICWDPSIDWALDGLKIIEELLKRHEVRGEVGELESLITKIHEEKRDTYD